MIHLAILILLYFLPTIVAHQRGHSVGVVATLNLLFGWTGIGWLALLLWAVVSRPPYYRLGAPYTADTYWNRL